MVCKDSSKEFHLRAAHSPPQTKKQHCSSTQIMQPPPSSEWSQTMLERQWRGHHLTKPGSSDKIPEPRLVDPLLSAVLEYKRANQSAAFSSSDNMRLCAPFKLMQSFQVLVNFRLDLWILSSSWFNVVCGTLLKVMLVITWGSKEIYVSYLSKIKC